MAGCCAKMRSAVVSHDVLDPVNSAVQRTVHLIFHQARHVAHSFGVPGGQNRWRSVTSSKASRSRAILRIGENFGNGFVQDVICQRPPVEVNCVTVFLCFQNVMLLIAKYWETDKWYFVVDSLLVAEETTVGHQETHFRVGQKVHVGR